jgi:hypothetical protein
MKPTALYFALCVGMAGAYSISPGRASAFLSPKIMYGRYFAMRSGLTAISPRIRHGTFGPAGLVHRAPMGMSATQTEPSKVQAPLSRKSVAFGVVLSLVF